MNQTNFNSINFTAQELGLEMVTKPVQSDIEEGVIQVVCRCGVPCKQLVVQKEGPNKGREFFTCPHQFCNYFQFCDEAPKPRFTKPFVGLKETLEAENMSLKRENSELKIANTQLRTYLDFVMATLNK